MRECFIKREYDQDAGFSEVILSNRWGTFVGTAFADEEDFNTWRMNEHDGLDIATYNADIECAKERMRCMRERMKGAQNLVKALDGVQLTTYEMMEMWDKMLRQCEVARLDYENARQEYLDLKNGYKDYIKHVQDRRKRYSRSGK